MIIIVVIRPKRVFKRVALKAKASNPSSLPWQNSRSAQSDLTGYGGHWALKYLHPLLALATCTSYLHQLLAWLQIHWQ